MMRLVVGDLWDWYRGGHWIVVPTNLGWTKGRRNVMGAGVAKRAAELFSGLAEWYGRLCFTAGMDDCGASLLPVTAHPGLRLVMFPVKPLDRRCPWLSWRGKADISLIEKSAGQLAALFSFLGPWGNYRGSCVALPLVGCGNGGLAEDYVLPVLERCLAGDRFVLVRRAGE